MYVCFPLFSFPEELVQGFRHILAIVAPWDKVIASSKACFVRQVRDEHLGVLGGIVYIGDWYSLLGDHNPCWSNWSRGHRIMTIGAHEANTLDSGDAWVLRGCLGGGGGARIVGGLNWVFFIFFFFPDELVQESAILWP